MKTVIEMARKSRLDIYGLGCPHDQFIEAVERFAELVCADEREACAQIVETPVGEYEVVIACGGDPTERRIPMYLSWNQAADAIRARGETSLRSNT